MSSTETTSDLNDGDMVDYYPVIGGARSYRGRVMGRPYQLASDHWMVRVVDLPEEYMRETGAGRRTVIAWLDAVRRVSSP